jgi:glycosyltransferase involved in cell wall biosynthesis
MKSILFLSVVMEQGWGVSLEIGEICRRPRRDGVKAYVGAQRIDSSFEWLNVVQVKPTAKDVRALARKLGVSVIAAQTSPYFEVLPELSDEFETWAWENGDPTPSFFSDSIQQRRLVAEYKREYVYPQVHRVIAISDFIKHDVLWPETEAILLGGDHMPTPPFKTASDLAHLKNGKVRVGTLMRLGAGEAQYKGSHLFLAVVEEAQKRGIPIEAHVAGRGTEEDATSFVARGIIPHLNLSEDQKADYLRSLDVFVSFSLWEGFNLPVVEAQTLGTLSLALDVGAHPEVCPFLLKDPLEALAYLTRASEDPAWLESASQLAATFARSRLSWEHTSARVKSLLGYEDQTSTKWRDRSATKNAAANVLPHVRQAYQRAKSLLASVRR